MPAENGVERGRGEPGVRGVATARDDPGPRQLVRGEPHHLAGEVEGLNAVAALVEEQREGARAAADVGDVRGSVRKRPELQLAPGPPDGRVRETVVGLTVEPRRLRVPEGRVGGAHSSSSSASTSSGMSPLANTS